LSWFLLEDDAKTTPILRFAQEQALRVKPMLELLNVILLEKGREAVRLSLILACYVHIKNDEEKKIIKLKRKEERSALWGENSNKSFNLIKPFVMVFA